MDISKVAATDKKGMAQADAKTAKNVDNVSNPLKDYEGTITSEADRKCLAALIAARAESAQVRKQVLELSAAGKKQEAHDLMETRLNQTFNTYKEAAHALLLLNATQGKAA
jgi:Four helix bundle sensory module for signal transduction